jgi:Uma2 family endonuclease
MVVESLLRRALPPGWIVRTQSPITLEQSEPEPDVVVARGELRDYAQRHPGPVDLALVIEVADSTLEFDRQQKAIVYAAAKIPEYWIVNLVDRQLEVHREPQAASTGHEYRLREIIPASGRVKLVIAGQQVGELKVADLLP